MRLVEAVLGELLHQVENSAGRVGIDPALSGSLQEYCALLGHFFRLLLAHRASQHVGTTERVARQHLRNLHDLFLVQNDAVGILQNGRQVWMRKSDLLAAVLTIDEVVHHAGAKRPGAEQRHQGDDVLEVAGAQPLHEVFHAARFQLEHCRGLSLLEQGIDLRVVEWQSCDVDDGLVGKGLGDHLEGPVDDRQSSQSEKVEFNEPDGLDIILVELGNEIAATLFAVQWREVGQFAWSNHHAPGVLADIAYEALEALGHLHDFLRLFVDSQKLDQRWLVLTGFFEGHSHFEWDQLRQLVGQRVGLALHPRHIAHDGLGSHGAKGDDLGNRVMPVALGDVLDHTIASIHAEVDVKIRHGHAFGIQEALKQQIVGDGIEVSDAQGIGHQRSCTGAAPRPHRNPVVAGPLDELHDDQEIACKTHLVDDGKLELQPLLVLGTLRCKILAGRVKQAAEARVKPVTAELPEVLGHRQPSRNRITRQEHLAKLQLQRAAPGNFDRVLQSLRQVGKQLRHFRWAAQVLLLGIQPRPARIVESTAIVDADPDLVRLEIFLVQEAHIIGSHHRRRRFQRQLYRALDMLDVTRATSPLQFEIVGTWKQLLPGSKQLPCQREIVGEQGLADIPASGRGQGNQPFGMAF